LRFLDHLSSSLSSARRETGTEPTLQ